MEWALDKEKRSSGGEPAQRLRRGGWSWLVHPHGLVRVQEPSVWGAKDN